jgi:hypothetical protein
MSRIRLSHLVLLAASVAAFASAVPLAQAPATPRRVPTFKVDPFWPKPLPNHWILGAVAGVAVGVVAGVAVGAVAGVAVGAVGTLVEG